MSNSRYNLYLLIKVVTIYVGSVIGAGFATGQEIMQFFILHGYKGLYGAILAGALFAYLGGIVMYLSIKLQAGNYRGILSYLLGSKYSKIIDILNLLILLGGLCVMLAGGAAVFEEHLGLSPLIGSLLVAAVTALIILWGAEGVFRANVLLVPLKTIAVVFIAGLIVWQAKEHIYLLPQTAASGGVAGTWYGAAFLYVSYNMVVPLAVLASLGRRTPLSIGVAGGIAGGLLLGAAAYMITLAGLLHLPEASAYEIPLLYLAGQLGSGFHVGMCVLIWLAIVTTAISNTHGIASRLAPDGGFNYRLIGISACLLVLPAAGLGFINLVRMLYPVFGCVGSILTISLLLLPPLKLWRK